MTDTTDIKALREFLMEQIDHADSYGGKVWLCAEDARLAMSSLDQLEAERQRADELRVGLESEISHSNRCIAKINTLEEKLAALKGEQVPVAWRITPTAGRGSYVETNPVFIEKLGELAFRVEPLFTAPQKPVVLLPKFTDRHTCINAGCDAASAYKEDVIAMNKAAGGIVKDGE